MDINLNDESGIELRRRLKAAGILVPGIYITGNDNPAVRKAALESGCLAYLTKPFSAKALIEPVERASAGPTSAPCSNFQSTSTMIACSKALTCITCHGR